MDRSNVGTWPPPSGQPTWIGWREAEKKLESNFCWKHSKMSSRRTIIPSLVIIWHWSIFWPQILFFSPPLRSRIPVFFPKFSRVRVQTYAKYDQNWREAPKILGFSIPKVAWLKLGRNQVKLERNLGNLGNKTLRMFIFPHSGEFFRGVRSCFLPNFPK